jgi:hypothetical protein
MSNRRTRRSTLMALCGPVLLAAACSSTDAPPAAAVPSNLILDQLRNGGTPGLLFLPPMVPRPA